MRTIIASIFFFSLFSYDSNAQQNDFQLWNTLNLSKKINKSLRADLKYGARFRENASLLSTQFVDFKVKYKENKRWSFAIGYRSISDYSISNNLEFKNRFYADAYFSKKLKRYFDEIKNHPMSTATTGNFPIKNVHFPGIIDSKISANTSYLYSEKMCSLFDCNSTIPTHPSL